MSKEREAFIAKYANDVIESVTGTGIFPSVKMAQMIVESADRNGRPGMGITALRANNFFGIKADKSWTGPKMSFNTPNDGKPVSYFRVYNSPKDSLIDHSKFLIANQRYSKAGVFSAKTPEEQIDAIAAAGYAEGKNYATTLKAIVNAYNLKQLDKKVEKKKSG